MDAAPEKYTHAHTREIERYGIKSIDRGGYLIVGKEDDKGGGRWGLCLLVELKVSETTSEW